MMSIVMRGMPPLWQSVGKSNSLIVHLSFAPTSAHQIFPDGVINDILTGEPEVGVSAGPGVAGGPLGPYAVFDATDAEIEYGDALMRVAVISSRSPGLGVGQHDEPSARSRQRYRSHSPDRRVPILINVLRFS